MKLGWRLADVNGWGRIFGANSAPRPLARAVGLVCGKVPLDGVALALQVLDLVQHDPEELDGKEGIGTAALLKARDELTLRLGSHLGMPDAKPRLDMNSKANFVATTDIIGGNSGSPMVNARGELVGLAFDGNIHSISGSYWFDTARNRTVAVHPHFMRSGFQVYRADALARELRMTN